MGWTRHSDRRPFVAKMAALSDAAFRLDDELLAWCAANATDGLISARLMPTISPRSARRKVVDELVKARRLHRAGDAHCGHEDCPYPGQDGYSVHDYLEFNPSAWEAAEAARRKAEKQAKWREARKSVDRLQDGLRDDGETDNETGLVTPRAPRSRVDPDPDPEGGSVGGKPQTVSDPPPSTCPDHPDGTAEPCGPCGDARRRRETWDREAADRARRRAAERASAAARARAEGAQLAILGCLLCDRNGYRNGTVCDHDPATAERAKRGAAAAREALGRQGA